MLDTQYNELSATYNLNINNIEERVMILRGEIEKRTVTYSEKTKQQKK